MLFSKRKKALASPPSEFRYEVPSEIRNQVIHIWRDSIGYSEQPFVDRPLSYYEDEHAGGSTDPPAYGLMHKELCDEYGVLSLPGSESATSPCQALRFFLQKADTDGALDVIELSFRRLPEFQDWLLSYALFQPALTAQESVEKLNERFKEHAIGYRFEQGRILRIDSDFLHSETTEPALRLLYSHGYEGALDEFMMAHKHLRQGRAHYDDCLTNCGKALESTLKTICDRRKWPHKQGDTASKLIDLVFSKSLIPNFLQAHFGALRATLENGVPTIRNREGGHGSGEKSNEVPSIWLPISST